MLQQQHKANLKRLNKIVDQISIKKQSVSILSLDLDPNSRNYYKYWIDIKTRWNDNDIYGHVNNVIYYSYFDTIINDYLIKEGELDIQSKSNAIGYCVSSNCEFKKSIEYPQIVKAGLSVKKIGNSSVIYNIGIFTNKDKNANAYGNFVHVFVDPTTQKKVNIPNKIRSALDKILIKSQ